MHAVPYVLHAAVHGYFRFCCFAPSSDDLISNLVMISYPLSYYDDLVVSLCFLSLNSIHLIECCQHFTRRSTVVAYLYNSGIMSPTLWL